MKKFNAVRILEVKPTRNSIFFMRKRTVLQVRSTNLKKHIYKDHIIIQDKMFLNLKIIVMTLKHSLNSSQKTFCTSSVKTSWINLFREIIAVNVITGIRRSTKMCSVGNV